MPLALDKNKTFRVVLQSDKDKQEDKQPYFIYRYLTGKQWRKLATLQDSMEDCNTGEKAVDCIYEAAATGLIGWGNMVDGDADSFISFDVDKLQEVIGPIEAQELIQRILMQTPNSEDKKKLDLPSDSNMGESVKSAKEPKSAEISPARPNL